MIYPRVREHVPFEELLAFGNAGLAEAANRYDPERGVAFPTFAWYRVNGAIIDGLRKATHLPRRTWARLVALRASNEYLENRAERERGATGRGAPPATGDNALAAVQQAMSAIRTVYLISLEALNEGRADPSGEAPAMPGMPVMPAMEDRIDNARLAARLRQAIAGLPDKERALVTKYYWEGKNLLEAGAELGISKSWASRLHAQAVEKLRAIIDVGS